MRGARNALKRALPRSWWDQLRRWKRRTNDLSSPEMMTRLRQMKERGFSPDVVVDVGAASGDWTRSCRSIFPRAKFVMLEPLSRYTSDLSVLVDSDFIKYMPVAAGRIRDRLPLLIPDHPEGSSFLPASRDGDSFFKRSEIVEVVPLDEVDIPPGTVLLKLDVQGYELEVLAGAKSLIERTEAIFAECSLYPFQQDLPLVHNVVAYITARGFRVYDIAGEFRWPSGTLAQMDFAFVHEDSALIDPSRWH